MTAARNRVLSVRSERNGNGSRSVVRYPDRAGKHLGETGIHVLVILRLLQLLIDRYAARDDVHVIGDIFLYYEEGNPKAVVSPDIMVVSGVPREPPRRVVKVWEEGAVPAVVIEVTSKSTRHTDTVRKKALYERLGVREYFLVDPLDEYLHPPLSGYRLVGNAYRDIAAADDNSLVSEELGVRIVPAGIHPGLLDIATGTVLLSPQDRLDAERSRADLAVERTNLAEARALVAERRLAEVEARLAEVERRLNEHDAGSRD